MDTQPEKATGDDTLIPKPLEITVEILLPQVLHFVFGPRAWSHSFFPAANGGPTLPFCRAARTSRGRSQSRQPVRLSPNISLCHQRPRQAHHYRTRPTYPDAHL